MLLLVLLLALPLMHGGGGGAAATVTQLQQLLPAPSALRVEGLDELYATGKSQPGPARLELTRRQVVVPVCALEATVLVVHADHDVSLPLEGVVDAFRLPLEGSLTHLALGLRVQLRASPGRRAAATRRMASVTARRRSA